MKQPLSVFHAVRADGVHIELSDGRRIVDGMSSWWSVIHGYNNPKKLNEAVEAQAPAHGSRHIRRTDAHSRRRTGPQGGKPDPRRAGRNFLLRQRVGGRRGRRENGDAVHVCAGHAAQKYAGDDPQRLSRRHVAPCRYAIRHRNAFGLYRTAAGTIFRAATGCPVRRGSGTTAISRRWPKSSNSITKSWPP